MKLSASLTELRRCHTDRFWSLVFLNLLTWNPAAMLALFILDNFAGFSGTSRFVLLTLWGTGNLAYLTVAGIRAAKLIRSDREIALELESRNGITDNSLVNAVCFEHDNTLAPHLKQHFRNHADSLCASLRFPKLRNDPGVRKAGLLFLGVLLLTLLYALPFRAYAWNALQRFLEPNSQTASLNFTAFDVTPGSCRVPRGNDLTVKARAFYNRLELSGLKLLIETAIPPVLYPMDDGSFTLKNLNHDIVYSIKAGKESSEKFRITIVDPPPIPGFELTVTPPSYTGGKTEKLVPGDHFRHSAPEDSAINIRAGGRDTALFLDGKQIPLPATFTLKQDAALRLSLKDKTGLVFHSAWAGELKCVRDRAPEIRFTNEKLNLEAGSGELVPIRFTASDDFGLASAQLTGDSDGKSVVLKEWAWPVPGFRLRNEVYLLRITPALLPPGGTLELKLTAKDFRGQQAVSAQTVAIHYRNLLEDLKNQLQTGSAAKCCELLYRALREQTAIRDSISLRLKRIPYNRLNDLFNVQTRIDSTLQNAAKEGKNARLPRPFLRALDVINRDSNRLLNDCNEMRKKASLKQLNEIVLQQTSLIDKLRRLLGALALREKNEQTRKALEKENSAEKELYDQMKNLRDKLEQFKKEQKKIKADTENFDPKKTDDWSEGEEKLLGDLASREQDWAKFFKAAFSDLSKKQNQDFSNSAMADEFVELYEELQKAGNALKNKKIEIATLAEDTALNSGSNILTNMERWLSDKQDFIKWVAEEDGKTQDIKLSDLPAELTDIIGDLIEQEEDMSEDTNDSSNSFSYDNDDGLGWGVADGNIDSMQAKGITGNVMPNNNEVGGRSGEGRSGRSSGQFVEKEATGKGGRRTPTRLVQSPFEKGTVVDKSKDGQGGATGGGKQSGVGNEGLSGVTPDQDRKTGVRMEGSQAELKQKTEAMLKRLDDRNLPSGDVRDALAKLHALERIGGGDGPEARRLRNEAAVSLRKARTVLELTVLAEREKFRQRKKETFPVKYRHKEQIPPAFEEFVGDYFKAIAMEEASE